ncbi:DUF2207 domain-containing protein [Candidatus Gracilibacteria bacterium]|nr:DUF2207 domain-containing protein [Candidatus Gracilibacteria bacterium]
MSYLSRCIGRLLLATVGAVVLVVASMPLVHALELSVPEGRRVVTNIYFRSYDVHFVVHPDSRMDVTEKITADVGNLTNKHGIFQVTSTRYRDQAGNMVNAPITLQSITNFAGQSLPYSESKNNWEHTVSWRIGEEDQLIHGVNQYQIQYQVGNVIDTSNPQYDQWKWDTLGAFWDLEIDNFQATIDFPSNAVAQSVSATLGKRGTNLLQGVKTEWVSPTRLVVQATKTIGRNEGVTTTVQIAKGPGGQSIFTPYVGSFSEQLLPRILYALPILIFIITFALWYRFGRDAKTNRTIIAEYAPPEQMSAMEMALLLHHGRWQKKLLSIGVMNLAVKEFLRIHITKKWWGLSTDVMFESMLDEAKSARITMDELNLLQDLMSCRVSSPSGFVSKAELQMGLHKKIPEIEERTRANLQAKHYVAKYKWDFSTIFFVTGVILAFTALIGGGYYGLLFALSFFIAALILLSFAPFMFQITPAGAEMIDKISGFKLFMKQVEQHRQVFFEKEGDLVSLLSYAMAFGITKLWLHKLKDLLSPEQWQHFNTYMLVGTGGIGDITTSISTISSAISSSVSSGGSSGTGSGGGSSGGGGW